MTKQGLLQNAGPMFNAYPDSIGETLDNCVSLLKLPEFENAFRAFYILPSLFNTDLDRGFSVIDYELNEAYASYEDLQNLKQLNIELKLDFILNHCSVLSKQFQDIIKNGESSKYKDFFINWNKCWDGYGEMTDEGYIRPYDEYIKNMFFRKPGLPILMVRMPDGSEVPYWNTFYQEVKYNKITSYELIKNLNIQYVTAERIANLVNSALDEGKKPGEIDFSGFEKYRDDVTDLLEANRQYLGQMDLNIKSPLVWEFYDDTLKRLNEYGASIIRLDAFAYAPKEPGEKNFMNEPGTWELLERVRELADKYNLTLLPEIHSRYEEKVHEKLAEKGYLTYDFFLPGLIIDALERHNNKYIIKWINDIIEKNIKTVNMLGCHDGIPLLDLKGLIPDDEIDQLIGTIVSRGGLVKDLHGKKNIYYQVNSTYFSALGEDERKLLLARAIQIFTPGIPQVWYLDLFAGTNDYEAVKKAGPGGHKEINRTNLTMDQVKEGLKTDIVRRQLELLRFRNTFPAFGFNSKLHVIESEPHILKLRWEKDSCSAALTANLRDYTFEIKAVDENKNIFTL